MNHFSWSCLLISLSSLYFIAKCIVYFSFLWLQLQEMNGKMIVSKPLYVALAQRKEDRRAKLQVFILSMVISHWEIFTELTQH